MEDNKELLDILSKEENLDAIYDIANNKNIVVNRIIKREFEIIFKKVKSRKPSNLQRVAIKCLPVKIM